MVIGPTGNMTDGRHEDANEGDTEARDKPAARHEARRA
jgi:hypothetical protein